MRDFASILIAASLLPAQTPMSVIVKQRVSLIPQGTAVEVRTLDMKKLRGRVGSATDTGFAFQRLKGRNVIDDHVPFDRVLSVRELKRGGFRTSAAGVFSAMGAVSVFSIAFLGLVSAFAR